MSEEIKKPEPKSLPLRMKEVFHRPGQPLNEFMDELKQLTPQDKDDFRKWFNEAGLPVA